METSNIDSATGTGTARRTIGNRYTLETPVGSGGMGTVWRAHDELLRRDVAVKEVLISPGLPERERELLCERTLREARAAAAINHSAVVGIYDVVQEHDRPWIVMELLTARSIAEIVKEDGPMAIRRVAETGLAVLGALEAAHRARVLHRDVKPGNVLLCTDGRVVLTDFGVARSPNETPLTSTGLLLGSPQYIAPERARGRPFGPASDLFSLGATLYAAIEGRPPFDRGDPLPTMTAVVCEEPDPLTLAGPLTTVLMGLLVKDPAERFDAERTRTELRGVLAATAGPHPSARGANTAARIRTTDRAETDESARQAGRHRRSPEGKSISGRASALMKPLLSAAEATAALSPRSRSTEALPTPDQVATTAPSAPPTQPANGSSTQSLSTTPVSGHASTADLSEPASAASRRQSTANTGGDGGSSTPVSAAPRRTAYLPAQRESSPHSQSTLPPLLPEADRTRFDLPSTPPTEPSKPERSHAAGRPSKPWWQQPAVLIAAALVLIVGIGLGAFALSSSQSDTGAGAGQPSTAPTGELTPYSDPAGYQVGVPRGWQKVAVNSGWVEFHAPKDGAQFRVHITPHLDPGTNARSMVMASEGYQRSLPQGYSRISIADTKAGSYPGVMWDWSYLKDGARRHVRTLTIVSKGTSYELTLSAPIASFDKYQQLMGSIAQSFKLG